MGRQPQPNGGGSSLEAAAAQRVQAVNNSRISRKISQFQRVEAVNYHSRIAICYERQHMCAAALARWQQTAAECESREILGGIESCERKLREAGVA